MTSTDPRPPGSGIRPLPGEPVVAGWQATTWRTVAADLLAGAVAARDRPWVVAVDGRSGSGKTTAASALAVAIPGSIVIHTDDVAWYESFFGWDHLLAARVLLPLRRGEAVDFRPPAWEVRGRSGAITVAAGTPVVLVEGVGSARRSLSTLLDATVWVQSDHAEANRRGIERDGGTAEVVSFWAEWGSAEERFLADDRPWERARVTVCGTPSLIPQGDEAEVLVAARGALPQGPACRC